MAGGFFAVVAKEDAAGELALCKRSVADFHALAAKWRLANPRHRATLDRIERDSIQNVERRIEDAYWHDLRALILGLDSWFATEATLKTVRAEDVTLEQMPEMLRAEMERRLPAGPDGDRGPGVVRQAVEDFSGDVEARIRARQAEFARAWPERQGARMRQRLAKLDAADAKAWLSEIALILPPSPRVEIPPSELRRRLLE